MRNWSISLAMAFVLLSSAAFGAEAQKYEIGITGMTWGVGCEKRVRETLSKLDNVDQVVVDYDGKTATVIMKKGSLNKEAVEAAFKGSRYGVSSFKKIESRPKEYTLNISGMTWRVGCEKKVRETLSRLDGVEKVEVDFEKKTADVSMKPGAVLEKDVVAAALEKNGGYGVTGFAEKKPEPKNFNFVMVGISGMTWMNCVNSVRRTLSEIDGIEEVAVDLDKGSAKITLKEGAAVSKETVVKALSGTRFKVTRFEKK